MRFVSILFYLCSSLLYYDYSNTQFKCQVCVVYHNRGKEFMKYWPQGFESEYDKDSDEWYRVRQLIDDLNEAYKNIAARYLKVGNDSTSAIRFWTTAKGNLPPLYYIYARWNQWIQNKRLCHFILLRPCS